MEELLQKQREIIKKLQTENRSLKRILPKRYCRKCLTKQITQNGYCKECERQRAKENYKRRLKSEQV